MQETVAAVRAAAIDVVRTSFRDERVVTLFESCFDHSVSGTLRVMDDGSAFVITGDIPAMWLRDSACQMRHLLPFAAEVPAVADLMSAVLRRQMRYLTTDPYANAFNVAPDGAGHRDAPTDSPWVWERKYEVDSLAHPFHLGYQLYRQTGTAPWFDDVALAAGRAMIATIRTEQFHETRSAYRFTRPDTPVRSDMLVRGGRGALTAPTGLTWSGFRPSDDAQTYGYHVPGNAFAAVALGEVADLVETLAGDTRTAAEARQTRAELIAALNEHGQFTHPEAGQAWWYEVDGRGNGLFMDDANLPSLLSLPLLGFCPPDDPVYLATRRLVLSPVNPSFFTGPRGKGVGSPHTPAGHVWPLALCVEGLTAISASERERVLAQLMDSHAGTGVMHESFSCQDPAVFTRPWFSWANAMFCELVLALCGRPGPGVR